MTDSEVVDASVVVKLVIVEEFSDCALALYRNAARQQDRIVGPPVLSAEVANAVYQRFRRGDLSLAEANNAVAQFVQLAIAIETSPDLVPRAYAFARDHRLKSIYDCLYVVLADHLAAELWTADRRLFEAVAAVAPWVRWIGDYRS